MEANEIRLGNLVYHKDEIITIKDIHHRKGVNQEIDDYGHCTQYFYTPYSELKPISLTEEWLIKFGFEKEEHHAPGIAVWDEFYKDRITIGNHGTNLTPYHFIFEQGELIELRYVHQLQNLYYVITGKEIKTA